jgi:plasmid replication initiation protein
VLTYITRFIDPKKESYMAELVVKSNALIQASYTLGLVEQRLILMSIVGARESGEGITAETLLTIRAQDYAALFGVEKHTAYKVLSEAVETLFNRRATVEVYDKKRDRTRPMAVRWVTAMAYEEGEGAITLRFGHEVVPEITRLEENFTSYELEQVAGLKSAYAVRLYELLIQWRSAGKTPIFEINNFRNQLGVSDAEYPRMDNFKRFVLEYSVKQINDHTDIKTTYEQHKSGRTITGFSFKFKQKSKPIEHEKTQPSKGSNPLSGVKDWEVFYQKHKLNAAESMDEFSKRIRKEAAEGTFSLSLTD